MIYIVEQAKENGHLRPIGSQIIKKIVHASKFMT